MEEQRKKTAYDLMGDPLSSATRSIKKSLYVFSSLCALIGFTGVIPDEASVIGVKFPGLTQNVINFTLLTLATYNYIYFVIHAFSDFLRYRIASERYNRAHANFIQATMVPYDDEQDFEEREFRRETGYSEIVTPYWLLKWVVSLKFVFDFGFPLLVGIISIGYFYFKRF
jgi:hypothetical protein